MAEIFAWQRKRLSDRGLATAIGAALFAIAGWPLLLLRLPPYQDLPDHLATVCILLHPERYPEFLSNGWFKANSLFVFLTYAMAKHIGVVAAGRVFSALVIAATAFALPHFVLTFTDRRRLVAASLVMAPMVHHWWTLMGMLNFALAFPMALLMIALLAQQAELPAWGRALALAALGAILWFTHAVVLLCVALLAVVEALKRPPGMRAQLSAVVALLGPFVPAGLLVVVTILRHTKETTSRAEFGSVSGVMFQDNLSNAYDLWAHWSFAMSPLSAAGLVPALALVFFAARAWRTPIPMFSSWAFAALFAIYWFFPYMLPGFGYVNERVLPLLWAWALVRVPPHLPAWAATLLAATSAAWAVGLAVDLFRAGRDLDDFTIAAPEVPLGARLLTLNLASRISSTNTWPLLHASGMYTVLRSANPQDVWADSPSAPIRHARPPTFVDDPLRIRELLATASSPAVYCATLYRLGVPDSECATQWRGVWDAFWAEARKKYDCVLLWGAPIELSETVPPEYEPRFVRGRLELRVRPRAR